MKTNTEGLVGKNIRFLRKMKDFTQLELAKKIGISRGQLGAYEEFRCEPPIKVLIKIAGIFDISVDTLVKNDLEKVWQPREIENMMNIITKPTTAHEIYDYGKAK